MGDIIETVKGDIRVLKDSIVGQMEGDIRVLKDSIVNQNQTIQQILSSIDRQKKESTPVIRDAVSFQVEDSDPDFIKQLDRIQDTASQWKWMDTCLNNSNFKTKISNKIKELHHEQWQIKEMRLDRHGHGLHINFAVEKPYTLAT